MLLRELWVMFSWLLKPGATKISRSSFKERAPELFRKFPQIATSFGRIDVNGDGCISWEEFKHFCLESSWLEAQTQKLECVTVYACDVDGSRTRKDDTDPSLMCDSNSAPSLLPWEVCHIVEWRLANLLNQPMWKMPKIGQLPWPRGKHIDSKPFAAAGARGFLRFWPGGQLNVCQQNMKSFPDLRSCGPVDDSHDHAPGAQGCCIGLMMPPGTRLKVRFYVGASRSKVKEIFWSGGIHAAQVWSPIEECPPCLADGMPLIAGVEILKNFNGVFRKPRVQRGLDEATKRSLKPLVRELGVPGVCNGVCRVHRSPAVPELGSVQTLPSLTRKVEQKDQSAVMTKSVSLPSLAVHVRHGSSAQLPPTAVRQGYFRMVNTVKPPRFTSEDSQQI